MQTIKDLLAKIDGKKTYTGIILAVCYSILTSKGILQSDPEVWKAILGFVGISGLHKFEKILKGL